MGKVPYRDFYTQYPPGIYVVLGIAFKLFGTSVMVERGLGLFIRLAIALGAGRLAGRLIATRFSAIAAGVVMLWLSLLGMAAFAWLAALAMAFLACEAWLLAHARGTPLAYASAGMLLAGVSYFRHDLFVYLLLASTGAWSFWLLRSWKRERLDAPLSACAWTAGGIVLAAGAFWIPVFLTAGFNRTADDLFFDQVRYVLPARRLPFPKPAAFFHSPFAGAVMLGLLGPGLVLFCWFRGRWSGFRGAAALAWAGAMCTAVLPQVLGRTDLEHAVYIVAPALVCLVAANESAFSCNRGARRAWLLGLVGALLVFVPLRDQFFRVPSRGPPAFPYLSRASNVADNVADARREVLSFVHEKTQPGDPLFVGSVDHRFIFINEMDLYFLADRPGSTRYMQFEPNIVNRAEIQRQMIAEMERSQLRVAILSSRDARKYEPNDSARVGAPLLDEYFNGHFEVVLRREPYIVLTRSRTPHRPSQQPALRSPG